MTLPPDRNILPAAMPTRPQPRTVEFITVEQFFKLCEKPLKLRLVAGAEVLATRRIADNSLNRPALALTGFLKNFAATRLQIFGAGEMAYLRSMSRKRQEEVLGPMLSRKVPAVVITRGLVPTAPLLACCAARGIPLMRSELSSREFMTTATLLLEEQFAPRVTEHGTMMDIRGIGTLLKGESGVGKSEAALALIERGYALVADDFVYIRLVGERELVATSSPLNRGYMECRGLGIIDVGELFGVRSVRLEKRIDLVVTFVDHRKGMDEDRTGLEQDYYNILGHEVPHFTLPVRPGRDLARLVEVAAMIRALKALGHDPAKEFNDRLIAHMLKSG